MTDFPNRRSFSALFLSILAVGAAISGTGSGFPLWPSGLSAWIAGVLLWSKLTPGQSRQSLWLIGIGVASFLAAMLAGGRPKWDSLLTQNTYLLGMLAAVNFLQLLSSQSSIDGNLPKGKNALWRTIIGVHLLGSVINLSAVFIAAEKIGSGGKPNKEQALSLSRAYLAAATWSPFFAATAIAQSYAPGVDPLRLTMIGVVFACLLLYLGGRDIVSKSPNNGSDYIGYPLKISALVMPAILASLVGLGHWLFPDWVSLTVVSVACMLVVGVYAVFSFGLVGGWDIIIDHANRRLPDMAGEVVLFLSAGVLASGLNAIITVAGFGVPFNTFGAVEAAGVLALLILLAAAGIHTVISISMVATWLMPLKPDPLLLAMVFVQAWAIGLTISPMSGINLGIQGRYGISALGLAKSNIPYCIQAYGAAVIWLFSVHAIFS